MRELLTLPAYSPEKFRWIIGRPDYTNGGFNLDWNWHFPPEHWTVGGQITIEACQTSPLLLSQSVEYFKNSANAICLPAEVAYEVVDSP